jgi:hypothetical protein
MALPVVPVALAPLIYGLLNIASATGIVFANKTGTSSAVDIVHAETSGLSSG